MSETARARLTMSRRIGIDSAFPFPNFSSFLTSLSPARIDVAFFRVGSQQSLIELALDFDGPAAVDAVNIFKEALIRSEVALDFDCAFVHDGASIFQEEGWTCVGVCPAVACLPSGKELAVSLPLLDAAAEILRQAYATDSAVGYRIELVRSPPDPERARLLVPALAELRVGRRDVEGLEDSLSEAFTAIRSDGWSAVERICILESAKTRDQPWIEVLIRRHLRKIVGFLPEELLPFRWGDMANRAQGVTLQEIVGRLRREEFVDQLFERIVPSNPDQSVLLSSLDVARRPRTELVRGDYAFISYAHRNAKFVNALLGALRDAGVNHWYDKAIESGARWDEEIEDRIRNCGAVIACVSDDYQESRYCRRELKYADLVKKPILPVACTPWTWQPGLQMMFQELQVASFDGGRGFPSFHRALQSVAPQIFNS